MRIPATLAVTYLFYPKLIKEEGLMKKFLVFFNVILLMLPMMALADFIDNGDGTVTDTDTGLMWQQDTASDNYTWEQALVYCEALDFAGHTDWRLPTPKELTTIVDFGESDPAIDESVFPGTASWLYWSSTTEDSNGSWAWAIGFYYGYVRDHQKTEDTYKVRAVRSGGGVPALWPVPDTGQTGSYTGTFGEDSDYSINTPSYTKLDDGCVELADGASDWVMVRDDVTGLVWERKHNWNGIANYGNPNDADNTYTWYDGATGTDGAGTDTQDFIDALNAAVYGGFADWRMPTEKELLTIVNYGQHSPAVNTTYFSPTASDYYWSSDSYAPAPALRAWPVRFDDGYTTNTRLKAEPHYVRAVKDGCPGGASTTTSVEPSTTTTVANSTTTTTSVEPSTTTTVANSTTTTTSVGPVTTTSV
ncbi:MAG: DUF1566 domain-containing protein, partial [Deltaproteobacteria bacterium]|nr:DUF1566 domain-containing protein [Deltaproteobacteria bacterium]